MRLKNIAKTIVKLLPPWDYDFDFESAVEETLQLLKEGNKNIVLGYFEDTDNYSVVKDLISKL